jgi:hypothetical protein
MLVWALHLRPEIDYWTSSDCNSGSFTEMHLSDKEWEHVRYPVFLLYLFYTWTEKLSKSGVLTIHKAWAVHTALFEHFDQAEGRLVTKKEVRRCCLQTLLLLLIATLTVRLRYRWPSGANL